MNKQIIYPNWWVYIVECNDGTYYTGLTHDINNRVEQHNSGNGARYTEDRCPVDLVYFEKYETRSEAFKRELEIKELSHAQKRTLIDNFFD
jgi:putative endonuclease